jgi:tyrosyl-DNA phosphodiesterase 1
MPEMYGCHHSKCMVLFRRDDNAQVIVHTANMIEQDWRNLTQGVWLSPLLPIQAHQESKENSRILPAIGTGLRFKRDFLAYVRYYGNRTTNLVSQLDQYDFAAIRAALIAHVPAKFDGKETIPSAELWGWPSLNRALRSIPPKNTGKENAKTQTASHIVCQVSSIASLSDKWIRDTLFSNLATTSVPPARPSAKNLKPTPSNQAHTKFSVIFPTPIEMRTCLDGYAAGSSIHCKLQNAAQRKQFEFMRPHLCHWNAYTNPTVTPAFVEGAGGKALRGPAAPHIKTFISFHNDTTGTLHPKGIDWALLTSANMSTQAWGTAAQAGSGEVRVSSYELGVLVWPELFLDERNSDERGQNGTKRKRIGSAKMISTFGSDTPTESQIRDVITAADTSRVHNKTENEDKAADVESEEDQEDEGEEEEEEDLVIIGLRMPYDLPLTPYGPDDEVWSARSSYAEPDVFGRAWNV